MAPAAPLAPNATVMAGRRHTRRGVGGWVWQQLLRAQTLLVRQRAGRSSGAQALGRPVRDSLLLLLLKRTGFLQEFRNPNHSPVGGLK